MDSLCTLQSESSTLFPQGRVAALEKQLKEAERKLRSAEDREERHRKVCG